MQSKSVLNRILALLMCLALVLSYLPGISIGAKAEEAVTEDVTASVSTATDATEAASDLLSSNLAYNKQHWANIPNDNDQPDTLSGLTAEKSTECVNGTQSTKSWAVKATADATGSATAQIYLNEKTDLSNHYLMMDVKYVTAGAEESYSFSARMHGGESGWSNINEFQTITVTPGDWQTVSVIPSQGTMMAGADVSLLKTCGLVTFNFGFTSTTGAERAIYIDNVRAVKIESAEEDWIKLPIDSENSKGTYEVVNELSVGSGSTQSLKLNTNDPYGSVCFNTEQICPDMTSGILGGWFYFGDAEPSGNVTLTYSDAAVSNTVEIAFEAKGNGWYYGTVDCADFATSSAAASETYRVDIAGLPKYSTIYIDCLSHAQQSIDGLSIAYPYNTETFQQTETPSSRFEALTFISALDEVESAQLILTPSMGVTSFDLTMNTLVNGNGNVIPADAFEVYAQHYVTYTDSKNGGAQVTNDAGETYWNAEAYVEGTDGTFPDALVPMDAKIEAGENVIAAGSNQGIWVNLNVGADFAPGVYEGSATLNINGTDMLIPVSITIYDVALPEENHIKSSFEISWDQLGYTIHGENTTDRAEADTYYNYLISKRLMPFDHWLTRDNNWYVNTKIPELAADPAVSSYSLENSITTEVVTEAVYDEEGNVVTPEVTKRVLNVEAMTTMLTMLIEKNIALAEEGSDLDLFKKAFFYFGNLIDEPRKEEAYTEVNECSQQLDAVKEELAPMLDAYPELKESFLNLKHLVTGPNPADDTFNFINAQDYGDVVLTGDDHIYTPQYQWFHTEAQRALYETEAEVWWYGCNHPVAPYPTYQINNPLITSRVLGWMMYDYNIAGHLYWTVNSWGAYHDGEKVIEDADGDGLDDYDGTAVNGFVVKDFWNGGKSSSPGEGMLIYPGNRYGIDGPIGTIRLESIREGHEDYEYLWLLEQFTGSDAAAAAYTANMYEGAIPATDTTIHYNNRVALLTKLEELNVAANGASAVEPQLPTMPVDEQSEPVSYPVDVISVGTCTNAAEQTEVTNGADTAWKITYTSTNTWVYPTITLDKEYDISDHLLVMDVKYTGMSSCRMQFATINGTWGVMDGNTPLTADQWNTVSYDLSANLKGFTEMTKFSLGFNVPVSSTDYEIYIDNIYLIPLETVADDWIHIKQDTGSYYKNTTTSFVYDKLRAEDSSVALKVVAPDGADGKFALNTESAALNGILSERPDFSSGTLGAWFYFGRQEPKANLRVVSSNDKGSIPVSFNFVYGGQGWYYGTVDTSKITYYDENGDGTPDGDLVGIKRVWFTGIPAGYTVYIDGITFPEVETVTEVPMEYYEPDSGDWTNMEFSSDADAALTEDVHYADNSSQSLKVVTGDREAAVTLDAQSFVDAGYLAALPNFTKGTLSAWFYFGEQTPSASVSIIDEMGAESSMVGTVSFAFEEDTDGDGWYYGSVDVADIVFDEGDVEFGATKEAVAAINIHLPANYEAYIDCLSLYVPAEDFLSNATIPVGQLQSEVTNGSETAWKLTPTLGTENNWVYPTFTLDGTCDISGHKLVMDVMPVNVTSCRIQVATVNGEWLSGVTSTYLTVDQWNSVSFVLADNSKGITEMSKLGLGMELFPVDGAEYAVYIDNVRLIYNETTQQDWINMKLDTGAASTNVEYTLDMDHLKAEKSGQSMKIVSGAAEGTWTLNPQSAVLNGQLDALPNMTTGIFGGYFYSESGAPTVKVQLSSSNWKASAALPLTMADAGDGWYYGYLDVSQLYFFDENKDGVVDGTADEVIRIKLYFPANSTVYVDGLMFPTEVPEEYLPTEPKPSEPKPSEPEPSEPEPSEPEIVGDDFLAYAQIAVGELQSEVTNGSKTAWKLVPTLGTEHNWVYPNIVLDQAYSISNHKLVMDVKPVGMTSFQINLSTIDGNWLSGAVSKTLTVDSWTTVTFDLAASGYAEMSKLGLGMEINGGEDYAVYIDNVYLVYNETVEDDLINLSFDVGESTGTYEKVYSFTKDEYSGVSLKLTSTADTSAKASLNVESSFGTNYDMSTGVLSGWFYFGDQTPKATVNFAGNWKLSIAEAMTFGEGVDGWYYGKLDLSTVKFYEEAGTMTDVERLRIWVPAGYEPVYVDYLTYAPNGATVADEAESDLLYGAILSHNTAHWTEGNGLSYSKDYLTVCGDKSFQSWAFKANAAASLSAISQLQLTQSYDATGKVLLFDVKTNVATDIKVRFHNSGWGDITTDKTFNVAAGDWTTCMYDPSSLIVDGKNLTDVKFITFTFNFVSNTGAEREIYIDNVRLAAPETVEQDWINLSQDKGDWYCNSIAAVTDEKVKAEGSTMAIKVVTPADADGKFTFHTESITPDISNGTLGAWFYFGDAAPKANVVFTAGNWKASKPMSFVFGEGEDGWYYGSVDTSAVEFWDAANDAGVVSDLTAVRRIQIGLAAGSTVYIDGLTYTASKADVMQWNLVLEDDLLVNFHLSVDADVAATAQIKITVGSSDPLYYNVSGLTANEAGLYEVSAWVAAAQMTDAIVVQVVNGEEVLEEETYTVRGYADTVLADDAYSAYHAIVKEMLNYGAAAQTYFGNTANGLANDGIEGVGASEVPETAEEMVVTDNAAGIDFYAASLVYNAKVAVRFYFNAESVEGLTFTANGTLCEAVPKGDHYMIEIADILPEDLDDQITVTVTDGSGNVLTVVYGPMNYIVRMNVKGSENLKALLKAMYNYHLAAETLRPDAA